MNKTHLVAMAATLLVAPLAYAHDPLGTPKLYCEPAAEWKTHDYGPPATGRALLGFIDGNLDDCDGDFNPTNPVCWAEEALREDVDGDGDVCEAYDYDFHSEYALGGAWLLASAESEDCFGESPHHASLPTVRVVDASSLTGIEFIVGRETTSASVSKEPRVAVPHPENKAQDGALICGDWLLDQLQVCFDVCTVTFPPGVDGAYAVLVVGTQGHVVSN